MEPVSVRLARGGEPSGLRIGRSTLLEEGHLASKSPPQGVPTEAAIADERIALAGFALDHEPLLPKRLHALPDHGAGHTEPLRELSTIGAALRDGREELRELHPRRRGRSLRATPAR